MAIKDNVARGMILVLLRQIYPEGMDRDSVCGIVASMVHPETTAVCLEYLADKAYVEKREIPHPWRKQEKITMFRITAHGIDLCDGTIEDPGIVIPKPPKEA